MCVLSKKLAPDKSDNPTCKHVRKPSPLLQLTSLTPPFPLLSRYALLAALLTWPSLPSLIT